MRENAWKFRIELAPHIHSALEPEFEHRKRTFDTSVNINLLLRRLVHVGVFFDRTHQFRDSPGARFNLPCESFGTNRRNNALENLRQNLTAKLCAQPLY